MLAWLLGERMFTNKIGLIPRICNANYGEVWSVRPATIAGVTDCHFLRDPEPRCRLGGPDHGTGHLGSLWPTPRLAEVDSEVTVEEVR